MGRVIDIMKKNGAFLEGHFLLSSGRHSGQYCQCAKIFEQPEDGEAVVSILKERVLESGVSFHKIVGPAMGGVIVAYELARQMEKPNVFAERVHGRMELRRGFEIETGEKVLIVEDVVTTGRSTLETAEMIREYGGEVVGVACIIDRKSSSLDFPIISAEEVEIASFLKEECPICKGGSQELVKPGSRKNI